MPHFFLKTGAFKIKVQLVSGSYRKRNTVECLDAVEAYRHDDLVLIKQYTDANSSEDNLTNY
jgi:hypothetical protein